MWCLGIGIGRGFPAIEEYEYEYFQQKKVCPEEGKSGVYGMFDGNSMKKDHCSYLSVFFSENFKSDIFLK